MTSLTMHDGTWGEFQYAEVVESLRQAGAPQDVILSILHRAAPKPRSQSLEAERSFERGRPGEGNGTGPTVHMYGWRGRYRHRPMRTA